MERRVKLKPENIFEFEGAKLNYRRVGKGKPVVLLHGSMVADTWDGFEKLLGKYYEVYLPELPGFGASEVVEGKLHNIELFAKAFAAFIKFAHLEEAPIIAFSLGTVVAARSIEFIKITGDLVFVGMPVRLESKLLQRIMQMPVAARRKLATSELARGGILLSILKDVIGTADRAFVFKYLALLRTSDVRAMVDADPIAEVEKELPWYLSRVMDRTHFVYGEYDLLRYGAQKLVQGDITVIEKAGHDVFVSNPNKTLETLRVILDRKKSWWERVVGWWRKPIV